MNVYVVTTRGVVGITSGTRHQGDTPATAATRARFCRWLTEEVNAAARGFFAGGATEVIVNDGHGAGVSIDPELLDPRVTLFHGTGRPDYCTGLDETCDALASVGTHAMGGTPHGNLAHTMGQGVRLYAFNGIAVGETGFQAFLAGEHGVPFIFCAGDEWAVREMQALCQAASAPPPKSAPAASRRLPAPARARISRRRASRDGGHRQVAPLTLAQPVVFREESTTTRSSTPRSRSRASA